MNEFEYVCHSREFPKVTAAEIATAMGSGIQTAASNLVQMKSRQIFLPLLDVLLGRCSYIMKRLFGMFVLVL